MVTPALILAIGLGVYPIIDTIRISLIQYDLLLIAKEGTPFVGLKNYIEIFQNDMFIQALINTILFTILAVVGVVSLGLVVSQILNVNFKGRGLARSIIMIPWFMPPVVASMIWVWMFQTDRSPFNQVLRELGWITSNIKFLTDTNTWFYISIPMLAVTVVRIWSGLPFVTLFLLAGLQSIPGDIYEAAKIDGANFLQRFFYLTLPMLKPVMSILLVLLILGGLSSFDINYVMTAGGPRGLTNLLSILSYQQAFSFFRFDLAAAISNIIFLLTAPLAVYYIYDQIRNDA